MEPAPVPSQACFCNDNQPKSGSDTKKVGVWLEEPTFIHGQLYVAASRVGDPQDLHLAAIKRDSRLTRNVVYEENNKQVR